MRITRIILAQIALSAILTFFADAQPILEGSWQGTIEASGVKLRVVFNIVKTAQDSYTASMDSPDQGAKGIPVEAVTLQGSHVHFDVKVIAGSFDGEMQADKPSIEGTWKQGPASLPLKLERLEQQAAGSESAQPSSSNLQAIKGYWSGPLKVSTGATLTIVLKAIPDSSGRISVTFDSPDQGVKDIATSEASVQGTHVKVASQIVNAVFEADLSADGKRLVGTWKQSSIELPLTLEQTSPIQEPARPQEPKPPFPYEVREVSYENAAAKITLAGTLSLPRSGAPFPAVLLITGSGPEDRDETVFGHKPFLVLADYLTRRGIAVLRVDDRGMGKSTGSLSGGTSEDFASDVAAGVAFLKAQKEVNRKKIGLIGHSEGGLIAPMVAATSRDVAFIVLMAGPGISGDKILFLQSALLMKVMGASDKDIEEDRVMREQIFAVLKNQPDSAKAAAEVRRILTESAAKDPTASIPEAQLDMAVKQFMSPWLRFFLFYDPAPALTKIKCPVLAINGEKDLQVPPKENLSAVEIALKAGGNKDFTVKELPGLNHLFQTAQTGSDTEYSRIEETVSPTALATIGDWIEQHVKKH